MFDHPDELPADAMDPALCSFEGDFYGEGTVDWTHGNAVARIPGSQDFVVSLRNLDAIVKVSRAAGNIVWKLGDGMDFELEDPDGLGWFYGQHDAKISADGTMLVFDNHGIGTWSRAMEFELDETKMSARPVWSFRVPYTAAGGTVDKLDNGHYLISTGNAKTLHEVDPDGHEVWSARFPPMPDMLSIGRIAPYPAIWRD
ncbi:MAG: aryl-sulfate sulfotransferase [Deltaproteobacteria bacterium]|nr:aryl-sulfate sulfotransferase [Deltaproteobacteria bacterium]